MIGTPTFITPGFADQAVFNGLAIIPIRFIGNTVFASYSISPQIGSGISFNTTTGVISGTYTGNPVTVSYQVTGTNSFGSTTASFTLSYKRMSYRWYLSVRAIRGEHRGSYCLLLPGDERLQPLPRGVVLHLHG